MDIFEFYVSEICIVICSEDGPVETGIFGISSSEVGMSCHPWGVLIAGLAFTRSTGGDGVYEPDIEIVEIFVVRPRYLTWARRF